MQTKRQIQFAGLAIVGLSCLLAWRSSWFQFAGYDLSPIIDFTYRMSHGENPGRDFINTLPLTFVAWLKLNATFFGLSWGALTLTGITIFLVTAAAAFAIWPLMGGRFRLEMLAVLAIPLLVTNHIWHSYFSGYLGVLYFLGLLVIMSRPDKFRRGCVIVLLTAGPLFFAKQNAGLPFIALSILYICLLTVKTREWSLLWVPVTAAASIAVTVLIYAVYLGQGFNSLLYTFTAVTGRIIPSDDMIGQVFHAKNFNFIVLAFAAFLVGVAGNFKFFLRYDRRAVICYIALAVGALEFLTDWDIKFNDLSLLLIPALALMSDVLPSADRRMAFERLSHALSFVVAFLFLVSIALGHQRARMQIAGPFYQDESEASLSPTLTAPLLTPIPDGYLKGLVVGPRMMAIRSDFKTFLAAHPDAARDGLYCGPRIEFCYADFHLPSPTRMPVWWQPGSSYAISDEPGVSRRFENLKDRYLVFWGKDRTRMPQSVLSYISDCYTQLPSGQQLSFYSIKPACRV